MNEELEFFEIENETETKEPNDEITALQNRISMLIKDNAELISDNLALRAEIEALREAKAALPEFSVRTQAEPDRYGSIREVFKNANPIIKRK